MVLEYRRELDPALVSRATSVPSRSNWSSDAPGTVAPILVGRVREITGRAPVRRTTTEILDAQAAELAGILLSTSNWYAWLRRYGRKDAADLVKQANASRAKLKTARARLRQAKSRSASFKTFHRALAGAIWADIQHKDAIERLNSRRSGLPEPSSRHRLSLGLAAALTAIHTLYYDYGIPDRTIAELLKETALPPLSPRNIKRLRTGYRRP